MNRKFEYKLLTVPGYGSLNIKDLNNLGKEGWELTTVVNNIMVFKREVNEIIIKG